MVTYREGDWWIAHCLELDIPAEGKTEEEAIQNLLDLLKFRAEFAVNANP